MPDMAKSRGRGRPSQGRSEHLEVMLTPEEKQRFADAAQKDGLSVSDWVRINLRACSGQKSDEREGRSRRGAK
jgi:mobilization protein NikA